MCGCCFYTFVCIHLLLPCWRAGNQAPKVSVVTMLEKCVGLFTQRSFSEHCVRALCSNPLASSKGKVPNQWDSMPRFHCHIAPRQTHKHTVHLKWSIMHRLPGSFVKVGQTVAVSQVRVCILRRTRPMRSTRWVLQRDLANCVNCC